MIWLVHTKDPRVCYSYRKARSRDMPRRAHGGRRGRQYGHAREEERVQGERPDREMPGGMADIYATKLRQSTPRKRW
jgi:hypothetical protein